MVSTFSSNIQLEEPANGDKPGTWDTPIGSNWTILDLVLGGVTTVGLNNANVTLTSSQFQCKTIIFNSTLTGSVIITFPTSFRKDYEIFNTCTGSSSFTVTLTTTAAGGQVICAPPNEGHDVYNTGSNMIFKSLHRVGEYIDFIGSGLPNWVSGCTIPPYILCDGSGFSSATYPQLSAILGTSTVPDLRGRTKFALNQTTGRITAGGGGLNGNTIFSAGGNEDIQAHVHAVTDPTHTHGHNFNAEVNGCTAPISGGGVGPIPVLLGLATINSAATGISLGTTGSGGSRNMPPAYIGGLTMIRGA